MAETTIFQHVQPSPKRWGIRKGRQDRQDEKNKKQPTRPAPAASTTGPCPTICQSSRTPGTGSYPAPSPDPTTHWTKCVDPDQTCFAASDLGLHCLPRSHLWVWLFRLCFVIKFYSCCRPVKIKYIFHTRKVSLCCADVCSSHCRYFYIWSIFPHSTTHFVMWCFFNKCLFILPICENEELHILHW